MEGFTQVTPILASGIYALVFRRTVVYIGKSKTMLDRVYRHRGEWVRRRKVKVVNGQKIFVEGMVFDNVWIMPVDEADLDQVEKEMIAKYRPRYNQKLMPKLPLPAEVIAKVMGNRARPEGFRREW